MNVCMHALGGTCDELVVVLSSAPLRIVDSVCDTANTLSRKEAYTSGDSSLYVCMYVCMYVCTYVCGKVGRQVVKYWNSYFHT